MLSVISVASQASSASAETLRAAKLASVVTGAATKLETLKPDPLKSELLRVFSLIPNFDYRTVLKLHLEGFKLLEIREITGHKTGTANAYLFRGRQAALEIIRECDGNLSLGVLAQNRIQETGAKQKPEKTGESEAVKEDNPVLKKALENSEQISILTREVQKMVRRVEQLVEGAERIPATKNPLADIVKGKKPCPFSFLGKLTLGEIVALLEINGELNPGELQQAMNLATQEYERLRIDHFVPPPERAGNFVRFLNAFRPPSASKDEFDRFLKMEEEDFFLCRGYSLRRQKTGNNL